MRTVDFPEDVRPYIEPRPGGQQVYRCIACGREHSIDRLLYTCPDCGGVLMLPDKDFDRLKKIPGALWRRIFDSRKMLNAASTSGIFLFHEFIAPGIAPENVVYLGEGHTPLVRANGALRGNAGADFYFKNDGQNPSASFKDRGMACALSYIKHLARSRNMDNILAVCASTGDTSASAALYSSYLRGTVASAVLLPQGKVTPQQLGQPLGAGARVFEIPGVFDDCMKVVEYLADHYNVALLNSKNAWRIRGQMSYSYEIAQRFDYDLAGVTVMVPVGNAGNITAVMDGFLNFLKAGVIETLPDIVGVQSEHADPVYKYYLEADAAKREFIPVTVKPSVAQASMIGNPVSMPRVISVADEYNAAAGRRAVNVVEVPEQEIMDSQLLANRNGHIVCTQGGMCFAGMLRGLKDGVVDARHRIVLDSTAHELKFSGFRQMYNDGTIPAEYGITPRDEFKNAPEFVRPASLNKVPAQGAPLTGDDLTAFIEKTAGAIADELHLEER